MKKSILTLSLILALEGCSINFPVDSDQSTQEPTYDNNPPVTPPTGYPNPDEICNNMAVYGLNVEVFRPLGRPPATVQLKLIRAEGAEILDSFEIEKQQGQRKQEGTTLQLGHSQNFSGAVEKSGSFSLEFWVDQKRVSSQALVLEKDKCHVIPQSLKLTIPSDTPFSLDPSKDYYPLDGGSLLIVDRTSKAGQIQGQTRSFSNIEIVRVMSITEDNGEVSSYREEPERVPAGKILIGTLQESGIDRGPLGSQNKKDTGRRQIYGQL